MKKEPVTPLTLEEIEKVRSEIHEQVILARDMMNELLGTLNALQSRILKLQCKDIKD